MTPFTFTSAERFVNEIEKDEHGRECLFGLTFEDTEFLMERRRGFALGLRDHEAKKRASELDEKHRVEVFRARNSGRLPPTRSIEPEDAGPALGE